MRKNNYILKKIKLSAIISILFSMLFAVMGCSSSYHNDQMLVEKKIISEDNLDVIPKIVGLKSDKVTESEKIKYAKGFKIYYYNNKKYKLVKTLNDRNYLIVPDEDYQDYMAYKQEKAKSTKKKQFDVKKYNCWSKYTILNQNSHNIYLVASSVMSLFKSIDAMDKIKFSGTNVDSWYIEEAKNAMREGQILYAGKYSQPDYESLIEKKCDLAIQSTMILHTPKVKEKLEKINIPVFIDESSYETNPLGRLEWIKVYGEMTGKREQADSFFKEKIDMVNKIKSQVDSSKSVKNKKNKIAYFYINSAGKVVVRKSEDYIPNMIKLGGGEYAFKNLKNTNSENKSGAVTISMEEFYVQAKDCDYLIYNSTIDAPIESKDELIGKNKLFEKFKAVKNNCVFNTDKYLYQSSDSMAEFIVDINSILKSDYDNLIFIKHIE
ncbi:ABC transporter substrate-binding protein [Lachnobacterium bovis]|nr:ABC transporter substrate-binding protein [Lachnobacterium bovis]